MTDSTSNPTFDITKWEAEQRARTAAADAIRPANKAALFGALADAKITFVTVEFDGCGDSGQIESIDAKACEADADLPDATITLATLGWRDTEPVERSMSVREAVEDMAYDCLAQEHGGWEINAGAFGTFTFDVADRSITLEFNQRFEDVDSSEHVF
ncbi:hypothetical protein ILP92_17855 [Maribius pontilimi]|uniref:DUF6878 domain-containing protein n=1 Tax=Palleronia pontilimi TaxID=1964209 RepID=A0A934IHS5_9RHOB|nr:DUF6878 family protein [Palleronia pontilimi]MBJ3764602.1 hypothetical protein [Palleronia pontilimi]